MAVERICSNGVKVGNIDVPAIISALLLIEMDQRPGWRRMIEWMASIWPSSVRPAITRGPLQIADGPWSFELATAAAVDIVQTATAGTTSRDDAIHAVAAAWNGAASKQPGSRFGYAEVLRFAYAMCIENRCRA